MTKEELRMMWNLTDPIGKVLDSFVLIGVFKDSDNRAYFGRFPARREVDPSSGLNVDKYEDGIPFRITGDRIKGIDQLAFEWYEHGEDDLLINQPT